jgi:hypothetical protein
MRKEASRRANRRALEGDQAVSSTAPAIRPVQNHDRAAKAPQMINNHSTRLMAMARIQGTGEECRMTGTSWVDWGMTVPSDVEAGSAKLSVTVLARAGGRAAMASNQSDSVIVVCSMRCTSRKNRRLKPPAPTDYHPSPTARALSPAAEQRDREFLCIAGARRAPDAGLSARRTPSQSQNGRARCGCPRENRVLQRSGAAPRACPDCRTS